MSQNPARPLRVMLVGTSYAQNPPACDAAIDLEKCTSEALSRYQRERSDEARAAIPMLPDARPVLFLVQPLTRAALLFLSAYTGQVRDNHALSICCHEYDDAQGVTRKATVMAVPGTKLSMADDAWLDELFDTFGAAALAEVASVALDRAEAGPKALAPFRLRHGRMLPL